ncbi:4'-phosphopantetheinyl transferase family protein [Pseudoalteromonas prydzensis]|uniref:Enterobactin synthase component D n=1 Tax=Pseudoalteromonas prydzensis TaxID=182141 RepID=A0ABR9FLS7_9GAMM|nr:4'-phosphopantetheinyl transferase superfamily protein [Pseudoalteromonas prydzensis]MBE0457793.1 4'-phosphopantetheinyl transferase superfamily protein [Pseudoalteromonas prydzensis]
MLPKSFKLKSKISINCNFVHSVECWSHEKLSITLVTCKFDVKQYTPELFATLGIYFPDQIKRSVYKRQAEFLAGRFAAKYALLNQGIQQENLPIIHIGLHRAPIWPKCIVGSITHNTSKVVCVLGDNIENKHIGIDIESILSNKTASDIAPQIHNDAELNIVLTQIFPTNIATTLIFSAKESLFKALYPTVKSYFGFECAKVYEIGDGYIRLKINHDFVKRYNLKEIYICYFKIQGEDITTLLYCAGA